jgi:ABC-type glycerol-3-phosphate transport system permease component
MLPPILLALPFFRIWYNLDMLNSLWALGITYLTITLPFSLWILRPYIEAIPMALEEAAMIDGCTRFQAFRKVIVPQAWPGIVASFVFTFVVVWNELLYSLVLISDEAKRTVSLGIASLILETSVYSWGLVNAAGVLATVPVLFLFAFASRQMVSGLGAGAVKG